MMKCVLICIYCISYHRAVKGVTNSDLFFGLCVLTRLTGGLGSAMIIIATTSILMKSTSYSAATIIVSIYTQEIYPVRVWTYVITACYM